METITKAELMAQIEKMKVDYGEWTYDIPLIHNVWTKGNINLPHTRLKRIIQVVSDLVDKPLKECRILDLGCLDGMFSIEFAQHGAETIGVEVREANIKKAIFCKDVLNLKNLEFRQDDARNISLESYGTFDAIICSGLLYHLTAPDAIGLISKMHSMSKKLVIIDTLISLIPKEKYSKHDSEYWGLTYQEHNANDTEAEKQKRLLASIDNNSSFWFTRPSLVNIINKTGFTSIYECFTPTHINFGNPGTNVQDRCTFIAIKGIPTYLTTSPAANTLSEYWPEGALAYGSDKVSKKRTLFRRVLGRLHRLIK